jgi:hypothetical protein
MDNLKATRNGTPINLRLGIRRNYLQEGQTIVLRRTEVQPMRRKEQELNPWPKVITVLVQMNDTGKLKVIQLNSRFPMDYCLHKGLNLPEHIVQNMYGTVKGGPINMRHSYPHNKIHKGDILNISTRLRGGNQ